MLLENFSSSSFCPQPVYPQPPKKKEIPSPHFPEKEEETFDPPSFTLSAQQQKLGKIFVVGIAEKRKKGKTAELI